MSMFRRRLSSIALLLASSPFAASAQAPAAHPNFAGTWVMDTAKTPGPMLPQAMTYTIEHRGDTIKIQRYTKNMQGEITSNLVYGTDGKAWKNQTVQRGMPVDVSSVLTWVGSTLVITSTLNTNGQEIHQVEKWSLDSTTNVLTADRTFEAMGQQMAMKIVFNKRP